MTCTNRFGIVVHVEYETEESNQFFSTYDLLHPNTKKCLQKRIVLGYILLHMYSLVLSFSFFFLSLSICLCFFRCGNRTKEEQNYVDLYIYMKESSVEKKSNDAFNIDIVRQ